MLLSAILAQIPGIEWTGDAAAEIHGISYDSRSVQKGDLFVAIQGAKADGARFVAAGRSKWRHRGCIRTQSRPRPSGCSHYRSGCPQISG